MFEVQVLFRTPIDQPDELIEVVEAANAYITGMEVEWYVSGDSLATVVRAVVALTQKGYSLEVRDVEESETQGQ